MTDLYRRVLLWHKLVAQTTGGLALCSAKHKLNRDEATGWATALRNVADEIDEVLAGGAFILDEKGRRLVGSVSANGGADREVQDVKPDKPLSVATPNQAVSPPSKTRAGGLRIAKRKQ